MNTHKKLNGAASNTESNLSNIPPCPGNIFPESLTPMLRFNNDSVKSPKVEAIIVTSPKIIHPGKSKFLKKCDRINTRINANIAPPAKPSQVFFGDILSNILCLPMRLPVR